MTTARFPRGSSNARQPGAQTWLNLVWACNEVRPGFFGAPTSGGDWWAGGTVEEYPQARIIIDEHSVRIVGTSSAGDLVIEEAAGRLGVQVTPNPTEVVTDPGDEEDWAEEDECEGHESLDGAHMGETVYCDGSCRTSRA